VSCRVVIDIPHKRHHHGNRFSLRIELSVPGEDIAITRDANLHGAVKDLDEPAWTKRFDVEATRRDIRLVLSDGFDTARRRLRDYVQVRRRQVKRHNPPVRGFSAPILSAGRRPAARPAVARKRASR